MQSLPGHARKTSVSRILITDSTYKHSIALARYIKRDFPTLHLTGCTASNSRLPEWYGCFDETLRRTSVTDAIRMRDFDMVIPVGGTSVLSVSRAWPQLAVLPSVDQLEICYDKAKTITFAERLGVPVPRTFVIRSPDDHIPQPKSFPCVVKPSREATSWRSIDYC
jgi:predicted ATP-grasp superfamily ATP-dependent carboligase